MDDHRVVLDSCQYELDHNGTCILKGWMYMGDGQPEVQVRVGNTPLKFSLTRTKRPDVLLALPQLSFPDENAGFEIRIENMDGVFFLGETLRVRVICEGETYPVLQKTAEEMREECYKNTIHYYMECVERRLEKVYIQGWCVDTYGGLKMQLLDEHGNPQGDVHWGSTRRPDLAEYFQVDLEQCHGFILEIPREKIYGKSISLEFANDVASRSHVIDMNKFDRENSRLGKIRKELGKANFSRNKQMIRELGVGGFLEFLKEESVSTTDAYTVFAKKHAASPKQLKEQAKENFSPAPLFSIAVPLYHTPLGFLKSLIESVQNQSYGNWQLCLADGSRDDALKEFIEANYGKDRRIVYQHLEENTGIAGNTNAALAMAQGDYIVFADHDDTLAPEALYEVARVVREYPEMELIYSDEDLMDECGNALYPHFKPDFNLDYLRSINYICHLVVINKNLLEKVGSLRSEFDGAQDHDFLLRCSENTDHIYHIPKVLYHWRSHDGSTAGNQGDKQYAIDAGKRALQEHYRRMGLDAEVEFTGIFIMYRTKFKVQGNPKVSILIPTKDHTEDLEKCIVSIEEKSTWKNVEIIVIENNSEKEETFAYYEKLKKRYDNVRVVTYEGGFNYSAINNFGAQFATGEYLLLLNNDTEAITPDWLERLLGYCQREDVAIAGAKLLYPDNTVQHAGVVVGIGGFAGHIQTGYGRNYTGYMGRLQAAQEVSAVTGACLMVKKSIFDQLQGLDESFAVAFNDVDFCLRARALGKFVVFVPDAELYHYESKSRGYETTPEKKSRFEKEVEHFKDRYQDMIAKGDPYYNPNLTLQRGDCSVARSYESRKGKKA